MWNGAEALCDAPNSVRLKTQAEEGNMNGLISMSLYGSDDYYNLGAIANAKLRSMIYPEWRMRCYCDETATATKELRSLGVEIVPVENRGGTHGMFWRFLAASDPDVDYVLFRDADSRFNPRERAAVDDWIRTESVVHVMHDHPAQLLFPIHGGMWGIRGRAIQNMAELMDQWGHWEVHSDGNFLATQIWPLVRDKKLHHGLTGEPFPPHLPFSGHVGERIQPTPWSLSIILPTIGRPHLLRTLMSVHRAGFPVGDDDEILLITDPPYLDEVTRLSKALHWPVGALKVILATEAGGCGYPAREAGLAAAKGTHLVWMDDDDIFTDLALFKIHKAISEHPEDVLIFRMVDPRGVLLWAVADLVQCGNFGQQQFVCPNQNLGTYRSKGHFIYESDFDFMDETIRRRNQAPIFLSDTICRCRP
jgi:hypothetical protein